MKLYLVRHGRAEKRATWPRSDFLRPLTARGERQAHGLIRTLESAPLMQIFSSASVRCRETVEGLASARGLSVEVDSRLRQDSDAEQVLGLLRDRPDVPTLICAGRHLLLDVLSALGVGGEAVEGVRCQKGSVWLLQGSGLRVDRAEYVPPRELAAVGAPRRLAVLDLGSTSFSLIVVDVTADPEFDPILRERSLLRLGAHCGPGGVIPEEDCQRALDAVGLMRAEAESVKCDALFPVGTAVLRDARNGSELAGRMEAVLGQPVRLLTGEQEGRLSYAALQHRLGLGDEPLLALDLGGGSLELAIGVGARCDWACSVPLGVTRLTAQLVGSEGPTAAEQDAIRRRVRSALAPHVAALEGRKPYRMLAAGGTVRALGRLALALRTGDVPPITNHRPGVNGMVFSRAELDALSARLNRSSRETRLEMPTVQLRRVELLPAGALILSTLLSVLNVEEMAVSDWGLREGIVLEALQASATA